MLPHGQQFEMFSEVEHEAWCYYQVELPAEICFPPMENDTWVWWNNFSFLFYLPSNRSKVYEKTLGTPFHYMCESLDLSPGLCDSKCLCLSYIALLFSDNVVFKLSCDAWKGTFPDGLRGKGPCKPRAQNIHEQDLGVMGWSAKTM